MLKFQDRATVGATKDTQDGYLVATSKIARTGIQLYRADEVGLVGNNTVRVYRAENEVFSKDALKSLQHAPVTLGHPAELVTSDNWAALAKGEVSTDILRDGDYLAASLMIKDGDTVTAAKTTHKEISLGYTAKITMQDGITDNGEKYDAVMTDFNYNHLALVPKGRAGELARIGDSATNWGASPVTTKGSQMEFTKVVIGDKAINVAASDADVFTKMIADKDSEIGSLTAKLSDATAKILTDEQIDAKVKALAEFTVKKEAVRAKFGDDAIKDASDAMIEGMHRVLGDAKDDTARRTIADMKTAKQEDPVIAAMAQFMKKDAK